MKKILALVLALVMLLGVVACAGTTETAAPAAAAAAPAAEPAKEAAAPVAVTVETKTEEAAPAEEVAEVAAENNTVFDDSEYAGMTLDELYQAALQEGGKVVVYTETGSTAKTVEGFQELYPGIEVEATKYKNYDIAAKVPLEYESNQPYADIVIMSDSDGKIYNEWYPNGYLEAYIPAEIKDDLYQDFTYYGLPLTIEGNVWWYNTEMYPDGCPINNWWDLLELNEDGTPKYHLYMDDASNQINNGCLSNIVKYGDLFAEAYKQKYGTDIEYTYDANDLGVEANNAGYEWIYRYLQGNYTTLKDNDEIVASVGTSTEPAFSFASSIKLGDALELGHPVALCTGLAPFNGFAVVKYIYLSTKTDNPAASRLFIAYSMGGADGQGKGYAKYTNRNGCYGVRYSHDNSTHSTTSLEDLNLIATDVAYTYAHSLDISDFWTYYAQKFAK